MTVVDFAKRYVKWVADNGVTAQPVGGSTDGLEILGYQREPLIIWNNGEEPLRQSVNLLRMAETPIAGLEEVQRYFGVPTRILVPWNAPEPSGTSGEYPIYNAPLPSSPVGPKIPGSADRFQHMGNEPIGTVRLDNTGEYVVEGDGPFGRWWKKVK